MSSTCLCLRAAGHEPWEKAGHPKCHTCWSSKAMGEIRDSKKEEGAGVLGILQSNLGKQHACFSHSFKANQLHRFDHYSQGLTRGDFSLFPNIKCTQNL